MQGTLLPRVYQIYISKNTRRDAHQTRKPLFPNLKPGKSFIVSKKKLYDRQTLFSDQKHYQSKRGTL